MRPIRSNLCAPLLALAVGACGGSVGQPGPPAADTARSTGRSTTRVCVAGVFHTIWNGAPRYFLFDDRGRQLRLLIDDETSRELGGLMRYDRQRVEVLATREGGPDGPLHVVALAIETGSDLCQKGP